MPILHNEFVKRQNDVFEYTPEHIKELDKCSKEFWHFLTYVKIVHPDEGRIEFEPYPFQKEIFKTIAEKQFIVLNISRQTGKTTTVSVYALWYAMFHPDKTIGIVSNKQSSAVDILNRFKIMYEELPVWLKPGVREYQKLGIEFDNGTRILVSATSQDAFRGRTLNLLICDEFAHVPKNIQESFWSANYPAISKSEEGKIVLISCVAGDTFVFTNNGPKEIKSFYSGNDVNCQKIDSYNVFGKNKIYTGNLIVNSGFTETKIIETTSAILEASNNHKIWACKNGKFGWVKASDLTTNDYISIRYSIDLWGNNDTINYTFNTMPLKSKWGNFFVDRQLQESKKLNIDMIDENWAYLFGLYISKGYARKHSVIITCGDDISVILDKLKLKYYTCDNLHYAINSIALVELLKFVGFDITKKAKNKVIPERLMEMSRENIIAMLQGIFDGDGYSRKDKGLVGIGLSSKKLIGQIRALLLNFGILTDYYIATLTVETSKGKVKSNSTQYRLSCSKNNSRKFYDIIGFRFERKQAKRKYLPTVEKFAKSNSVPCSLLYVGKDAIKLVEKNSNIKINRNKNVVNLSTDLLLKIKDVLHSVNYHKCDKFFDDNVDENIKWEKIKSIKNSENTVYDFSLPEDKNDDWCHSVVYNGVIGHQTPNGPFDLFHNIFSQAKRGENTFVALEYNWKCVPGRDENWARIQRKNLGDTLFRQEQNIEFLGSINTVISKEALEKLFYDIKDPIKIEMKESLRIYEKPIEGKMYVIGHDPAKGTGQNACCSQVLKIDCLDPLEYTQVASFLDANTNVYLQADFLYKLGVYYNFAYIICENNGEGSPVVNRLWWDLEYENLINDKNSRNLQEPGVRATMKNKPKIVLLMKKLIEDEKLHLSDKNTIEQLATFIEKGGRLCGKDNMPDDAVSALYWACWFAKLNIIEDVIKLQPEIHPDIEKDDVWSIYMDGPDDFMVNISDGILYD